VRVAITGAHGFLGWHLSCRLAATRGVEAVRLGRAELGDAARLAGLLAEVDVVVHVAGVNRADSDEAVEQGNVDLAQTVVAALGDRPVHVVYADSVQADLDNPYGRGKRRAAELLAQLPGTFADVVLPNLFGEHGRPSYNSFVATFCHEVAAGREPTVHEDRQVPLLHVQAAAECLIVAAESGESHVARPAGEPQGVVEVLEMLRGFHGLYAERGEVPDLSTAFARDLFNTYRSYLFPGAYPIHPQPHRDARGELVEAVRAHGGTGQAFVSSTVPGATRGDHYHLHKVERFMVVKGRAEIALRRLYHDDVVRFPVTGDQPGFVDMPTMWTHHIRNVGDEDVVTVFWADQLLDPAQPDQYPLKVEERA
jgi:UDP-2-acetamido-2,6-beta-L-arabino-hexul-4-ose reductase